jgi:RsiW-degrading membrane proteinase PrsW (M82 family)
MSRAIGSWIIINIILAACRGWFFRTTFSNSNHRQRLLVISCISSWLLACFPFLAQQLGIDALVYTASAAVGLWWGIALLVGVIALPTIIFLLLGVYPTRMTIKIATQLLILGIGIFLAVRLAPSIALLSRWVVAFIEEWTKTSTSLALYDRFSLISSDIIFFGLLSALGFAFVENMVYLRQVETTSVGGVVGLVVKRTLTSRVMHMCYTGLLAIGITLLTWFPKKQLQWGSLIIGGILLHTLFNTFISTAQMGITLLIIIFWYLFMSRLVYRSERVYIS